MSLIHRLAETRIKTAVSQGDLDDLPGQGKPLVLDDNSMVPETLRVGYRLLKNAGVHPPELTQRLQIRVIEESLQSETTSDDKRRLAVKLSLLKSCLTGRS